MSEQVLGVTEVVRWRRIMLVLCSAVHWRSFVGYLARRDTVSRLSSLVPQGRERLNYRCSVRLAETSTHHSHGLKERDNRSNAQTRAASTLQMPKRPGFHSPKSTHPAQYLAMTLARVIGISCTSLTSECLAFDGNSTRF
jgi:hypothetical protein